ncbi:hypothetical protein TcasGA2_TC012595 [Tribolium castaneum]|uniref:Uncharacterized protein n=1 Tax=Tribolium castaneum TaxID=7070 RepID=D6WZ34_TRICA|nr:hypothetical protein TcasGA2_TC012595 [Tribolium castaneum]
MSNVKNAEDKAERIGNVNPQHISASVKRANAEITSNRCITGMKESDLCVEIKSKHEVEPETFYDDTLQPVKFHFRSDIKHKNDSMSTHNIDIRALGVKQL